MLVWQTAGSSLRTRFKVASGFLAVFLGLAGGTSFGCGFGISVGVIRVDAFFSGTALGSFDAGTLDDFSAVSQRLDA